jgi:hypothetical protein
MAQKPNYTGKLAERSRDVLPDSPAHTVLGAPGESSLEKYRESVGEWTRRQVIREIEGIPLLLDHYKIDSSETQYLDLALALARDHVPLFMPPASGPGAPKSMLTQLLPLIDGLAKEAKSKGLPQSMVYRTFAEVLELKSVSIQREVKRFRQKSDDEDKES